MPETRTQLAQRTTTPIEAAHARGLREGRVQGRARFWWLLDRKNALGARYRNVVGRKRHLEAAGKRMAAAVRRFAPWVDEEELETPDATELRDAYRALLAALSKTKAQSKQATSQSADAAHKAG